MPHHTSHCKNASRCKRKRFEEKYLSLLRTFVEATLKLQKEEEEDLCLSSKDDDDKKTLVVIKRAPRKWRRKNILMDSDDELFDAIDDNDDPDECDTEDETVEMLEDPTLQDLIASPKYISWGEIVETPLSECQG